ncbi:transcriptional regulator [Prauserella sp. PE36]|uniref:Helix-turn-helix domain-containing protein n=1 Tax=Prauserella endophytica TaxID=1592324 RepID=A0ABY2SC06_9PSEU|nr:MULTISPECIES: helix-turn-helix domain-containing protein [Prauserella]PXY34965.1 transcriptional regulator [Prauserella coralliicola]RBM19255.1 transcriptional regulator [Prauserella sp. PE36]TKG73494.1 helix-turn-helix domain-containing protein [Prauserella endophytica]
MEGRMDARRLYDALDAQRGSRGMSWRQLADEAGVSPSLLSRMGNGHRPDLDGFIALVQWLGSPAEVFMVWPDGQERTREEPALETQLALLLRARDDLSQADKDYLLEIVGATMRRIKVDRQER